MKMNLSLGGGGGVAGEGGGGPTTSSYLELCIEKQESPIWDWPKLVLKAEWSCFRVVLILVMLNILRYPAHL